MCINRESAKASWTIFKKFVMTVWQLPQNILGFIVSCVYAAGAKKVEKAEMDGDVQVVYSSWMAGGISLGRYIVLPYRYAKSKAKYALNARQHEWGHTRQSRRLGWLYLIVIGLPSITWATLHTYCNKFKGKSYYSFFTEKWADKLGGVQR